MDKITVQKEELLTALRKNRADHQRQYELARERYQARVVAELEERLDKARAGQIDLVFRLPEPVSYVEEYDRAIQMIEWHIDDTVQLDQDDFRRYVQNQWDWARHFAGNTQAYLVE